MSLEKEIRHGAEAAIQIGKKCVYMIRGTGFACIDEIHQWIHLFCEGHGSREGIRWSSRAENYNVISQVPAHKELAIQLAVLYFLTGTLRVSVS